MSIVKYRSAILLGIGLAAAVGNFFCSTVNVAGGTSSTDNGKVLGSVCDMNGLPASNTEVTLHSAFFNPNQDTGAPAVDTTDSAGAYGFDSLSPGVYTITAVALESRTRALINSVMVDSSTTHVPVASLTRPGALEAEVESCSNGSCYVYIPGTSLYGMVRDGIGRIDSVPAGMVPAVYYADLADPTSLHSIKTGVTVGSGITRVITDYTMWSHSARVYLNTTHSGAGVSDNVYDFPVLVRLSEANFDFGAAGKNGADVRFIKPDETPFAYEIERWDAAAEEAEIWVMVDTVFGNDSTHFFVMYWGNPSAASASNSATVFDTAAGFEGVWHLSGEGNATAFDATGNHYDGIPSNMTNASAIAGIIGSARSFNGSSSYITMPSTSESKLNFPQNGTYTMSLWAYADTLDTLWRAIAGKGHEQYYMQLKCLGEGRATWEFVEFQDNRGWEYTEDSVPSAPGAGEWLHIVGVRDGKNQRLYINGEEVVDTASLMEGEYPRDSSDDFSIGRFGHQVVIPSEQGWSYFDGMIDEVRVTRRALTAGMIRLSYMNQKADDALVRIRQ